MLLIMTQEVFESGVMANRIKPHENQVARPPWLRPYQGRNLALLDANKLMRKDAESGKRISNEARVEKRLAQIAPALEIETEILSAENPEAHLGKLARESRRNETRFVLWFFVYLLFGRDKWSLLGAWAECGRWSRFEDGGRTKCGRPSLSKGKHYGHRMTSNLAETSIASYHIHKSRGKPMTQIYCESMLSEFGCKSRVGRKKWKELYHPQGSEFPSFRQFEWAIVKKIGKKQIQLDRYGHERVRNRASASQGSFAASTSNLNQRIEMDAYRTNEYPRGLRGECLPPLVVVKGMDTVSSLAMGIGFGADSETAGAYRNMCFCAAVGWEEVAGLFGIRVESHQVPRPGLPHQSVADRGAGASQRVDPKALIRETVQSASGQGKAIVESANPRSDHFEGSPTYFQSDKNPFQLAAQEIVRALAEMDSKDVSHKLTPEMRTAGVRGTPLGIAQYLEERGRSDAISISYDEAVRRFLDPTTLDVKLDGVYLHGIRFDSEALRATNLLNRSVGLNIKVKGFIYEMAVRHLWVEVDGSIVKVEAHLSIADSRDQLNLSLCDLQRIDELKRIDSSNMREHKRAVLLYWMDLYERTFGKRFNSPGVRVGRAKPRSVESRKASRIVRRIAKGR
ncbi:hypothetical protein [Nevskia soli]|uniref:hypothetical protein n=1 Tax=Nevskia soli TaxID=418856 RepID=UPI0012FC0890|nr:hypothetical protein [Nevskia soli]